jgi:hypothetical protein
MSCCGVYVLPQPSAGSQTLTYDDTTNELTISGGNTVLIDQNQSLVYDNTTNQMAITDGIGNLVNVVDLNPRTSVIGYWDVKVSNRNFEINIADDFNVTTGNYGMCYLMSPYIFRSKYNRLVSSDYLTDFTVALLGPVLTPAHFNVEVNKHNTGSVVDLCPISCYCVGKLNEGVVKRDVYYNNDVGLNTISPITYDIMNFDTDSTMNSTSLMYIQYSLGYIGSGLSFYFELYDNTNSTVVGTSATITPTATFADYAKFWYNLPISITPSILANTQIIVKVVVNNPATNLYRVGMFFTMEEYS